MLRRLPKGSSRGMLVIEKIDGAAAEGSPLRQVLLDAGYAPDYRGLIDVRPPGTSQLANEDG